MSFAAYVIKRVLSSDGKTKGFPERGYFTSAQSPGGPDIFWSVLFYTLNVTRPNEQGSEERLKRGEYLVVGKKKNGFVPSVKVVANGSMKATWMEFLDNECLENLNKSISVDGPDDMVSAQIPANQLSDQKDFCRSTYGNCA